MIHFQYKSRTKNKYPHFIILALITVIFVISCFISGIENFPLWLSQSITILAAGGTAFVLIKYVITDYVYELRDYNLNIYRIQGKKSTEVASLNLLCSVGNVLTDKEFSQQKKNYKINSIFNFRKNMFSDYRVYIFDFNSKQIALFYEPSEEFVKLQNELCERAKNLSEQNQQ